MQRGYVSFKPRVKSINLSLGTGSLQSRPPFHFHYTSIPPMRYNTLTKNKVSGTESININLY